MKARFLLLAGLSIAAGFLAVQYMVQEAHQIGLYAALLAVALTGILGTLIKTLAPKELPFASLLLVAGFLGGYLTANAIFLARPEDRVLPQLVRTDGGDGHTAILYFTHGEPPGYSAQPWIETIRELDKDDVPFVPWMFRPFFFNTVRSEYFEAGGSAHNKLHQAFLDRLRRSLPEDEAKGTEFYLAFLDSNPRPDEMAIRAINDGASRIIVLPVFITESTHTVAGQEMIASANPESIGVQVCYAGALWDSQLLQSSFVERANEMTGNMDKSKVGILLVGHGQPTEWEAIYPQQNRQETLYRSAIRDKLVANGYQSEHVLLGWMEFQEPSITASMNDLARRGVEKILVLATSLSADSIHSDIEVPAAVARADLPAGTAVEYVSQYGDHPLANDALKERIAGCR